MRSLSAGRTLRIEAGRRSEAIDVDALTRVGGRKRTRAQLEGEIRRLLSAGNTDEALHYDVHVVSVEPLDYAVVCSVNDPPAADWWKSDEERLRG